MFSGGSKSNFLMSHESQLDSPDGILENIPQMIMELCKLPAESLFFCAGWKCGTGRQAVLLENAVLRICGAGCTY